MTKRSLPPFHPRAKSAPSSLTSGELEELFPAESDHVERKTSAAAKGLQRTITAFSNTDGGVVLIGVDDDGNVVGRPLTPGLEDAVHEAAIAVHDPGRYWVREVDIDGVAITVVSVARRAQGFAQTPDGQVLVRRGGRSVPLLGAELLAFVTARSLQRFDSADSGIPLAEADPDLLDEVRSVFGWRRSGRLEERLRQAGLATGDGRTMLTVAGALTLIEAHEKLGKTFIEVLRFPDETLDYDRRVEVHGPVQHQVEAATEFVMDELGTDLIVTGIRRHELPKVPEVVVREAVANAVAHRTYEDVGRAVRIELRPSRVVVLSPGGLPEPVTEENIRDTQSARNMTILRVLRRFRLAEDMGRGVDVMQDLMAEALLDPPEFHDLEHSVRVTLPIRGAISSDERAWILEVERRGAIEPRDRILVVHAARGEQLTNARVRELLGVDSRDARRSLQRLRRAGFLDQIGERGGAMYILASAIRAPAAFRLTPRELRDLVVTLAEEEGALTNAKVRAVTGLERIETLRLLDRLVREGRLLRRGEKRGSHYVLP